MEWKKNLDHHLLDLNENSLGRKTYVNVFTPKNGNPKAAIYHIGGAINELTCERRKESVPHAYGDMLQTIVTDYGCDDFAYIVHQGYFPEGPGSVKNYLVDDVVPFIEENFGIPSSPDKRALIGVSNGGFLALFTAFYSGAFCFVSSHSAPAKIASIADATYWNNYADLKKIRIIIDCQILNFHCGNPEVVCQSDSENCGKDPSSCEVFRESLIPGHYRILEKKFLENGIPIRMAFYEGRHNWAGYGPKVKEAVVEAHRTLHPAE